MPSSLTQLSLVIVLLWMQTFKMIKFLTIWTESILKPVLIHILHVVWFWCDGLISMSSYRLEQRKHTQTTTTNKKKKSKTSTDAVILPAANHILNPQHILMCKWNHTHQTFDSFIIRRAMTAQWYLKSWCKNKKVTASNESFCAGTALLTKTRQHDSFTVLWHHCHNSVVQ